MTTAADLLRLRLVTRNLIIAVNGSTDDETLNAGGHASALRGLQRDVRKEITALTELLGDRP